MKSFFSLSLVFFFVGSPGPALLAGAVPDGSVQHVKAEEAAQLLKKHPDTMVLDIRTPKEYKNGHLAKAKNIDFFGKDFEANLKKLDRSKTYIVHCASGRRSTNSLKTFEKLGFKSVVHLDGGYKGWVKEGLPVTK